jgi:hypothetical protein
MELMQFNLDGLQESENAASPIPFSVEDRLFAGGLFDKGVHKALVAMFLKDLFPEPTKDPLFRWDNIAPNAVITYVSFVHDMNMSINKENLKEGRRMVSIPDVEVKKKADRMGIMTPLQIEDKFVSRHLSTLREGPGVR